MAALRADRISPEQMKQAAAWVRQVIAKPWRAGAQGPDAFDCWGLARATQKALGGHDLPIINADPKDLRAVVRLIKDHPLHDKWVEVKEPRHLDAVLMSHAVHAHHIGTFLSLDDGVILHATEQFDNDGKTNFTKPGVTADHLLGLKLQGWMKFQFMRRREVAA